MREASTLCCIADVYIKFGLVAVDGGAWLLPRLVGPAKAMELLMTGDFVTAEEAARLGIVNHVVDDDALMDTTYALAGKIAAAPPVQIAMIRRLVRQSSQVDLRTHFDLVASPMGILPALRDETTLYRTSLGGCPGQGCSGRTAVTSLP